MKTTDYAIDEVYKLLKDDFTNIYKLTAPTGTQDEFIVLNALAIGADVLQQTIVNVNYHVKDIAPGVADFSTLQSGTASILQALTEEFQNDALPIFDGQEYFREDGYHYSNVRVKVNILNK